MSLPDSAGLGSLSILPPELRSLIIKHTLPSSIITFHPISGSGRSGGRRQGPDHLAILRSSQALRTESFEYINLHTPLRYVLSASCKHTPPPPLARTELISTIEFSLNLNGQALKPGHDEDTVNAFDNDATMALESLISDGIVRKRLIIHLYDTQRCITEYFTQSKFFRGAVARAITFETIEIVLGYCVNTSSSLPLEEDPTSAPAILDVMESEMIGVLEGELGVGTVEAWDSMGVGERFGGTEWVGRKIVFWPVGYVKLLDRLGLGG